MDKKHGYGVYIWADGRRYEGLWQNGKQHGKGKYILPNNTVKVGIWEDGKRIRWIDQYQANDEREAVHRNVIAKHLKSGECVPGRLHGHRRYRAAHLAVKIV